MMIDEDMLKKLRRINDELLELCRRLNERKELVIASRLVPLTDELTHILAELGEHELH